MAFNPLSLLFMVPGLLQMLLGKGQTQPTTQETITETTPTGYRSPMLGLFDPMMADQLLRFFQSRAGAGMPGGVGNVSPMIEQILALLGESFPRITEQYQDPCYSKCMGSQDFDACYRNCKQGRPELKRRVSREQFRRG